MAISFALNVPTEVYECNNGIDVYVEEVLSPNFQRYDVAPVEIFVNTKLFPPRHSDVSRVEKKAIG